MYINDRTKEIVNIFKKLKEMNFGIDYYDEFITFREICNTFIRDGKAVRGDIKVHGTKRIICYDFNKKVECCLKYDESV
jgi:hypothetical protein